ncbi:MULTISPECIES: CynX/NimT family MFS transporter [Haloarcula]|uniref:MFS transporter n=1 Tax=Haloarcula TaxID=2237 RepID=UPI0023ED408E|nr:MFS transporter [Halomicroarcula sp. XH51]
MGSDRTAGGPPYALLLAATLGYTCLMFAWFSLPAYLSTLIEAFGLTGAQAGLLAGAVPLTYVPVALFSGVVVDRVGPFNGLAVSVALVGVAQLGRSAATGFPAMLAFTVVLGVGGTGVTFGLPKLVSTLFPSGRTGLPSSVYLLGASAGTASAFAVGRPILGPALGGWRPLFYYTGLFALGYAAVLGAVAVVGPTPGRGSGETSFSLDSMRRDLAIILRHRDLLLVVAVGTMYLLVVHGMQGWLPTILEARGAAPGRAGRSTALLVAANAAGVLLVPAVTDRTGHRRDAILVCGGGILVGVGTVAAAGTGLVLTAGVVATGLGVGGLAPLVRVIPPELEGIGRARTGLAVGLVFAVGEVGGFLGPVLVGTGRDLTASFLPGLALLAAGGVVVVLAGRALPALDG